MRIIESFPVKLAGWVVLLIRGNHMAYGNWGGAPAIHSLIQQLKFMSPYISYLHERGARKNTVERKL